MRKTYALLMNIPVIRFDVLNLLGVEFLSQNLINIRANRQQNFFWCFILPNYKLKLTTNYLV